MIKTAKKGTKFGLFSGLKRMKGMKEGERSHPGGDNSLPCPGTTSSVVFQHSLQSLVQCFSLSVVVKQVFFSDLDL